MSNINDYKFAEVLKTFLEKVIEPAKKRKQDAIDIAAATMGDDREAMKAKVINLETWLKFYQQFYDEGLKLSVQHENLVNLMAKWYDLWYKNISNEGRQECEMMCSQADMLQGIFCEIYKELKALNLDLKQPQALNLK